MAQIGLKNVHYALLEKDDKDEVKYGEPKEMIGAIMADIQNEVSSNTLHADDAPYATANALGGTTLSLEMAEIPLEVQAELLGHEIKNGVMESKGSDKAPYVAIMFESEKEDGSIRYVKLLKGRFQELNETYNTKTESVEFQTSTLEGNFVCRKKDKKWKYTADSSNAGFAATSKWYESVEGSISTGD